MFPHFLEILKKKAWSISVPFWTLQEEGESFGGSLWAATGTGARPVLVNADK